MSTRLEQIAPETCEAESHHGGIQQVFAWESAAHLFRKVADGERHETFSTLFGILRGIPFRLSLFATTRPAISFQTAVGLLRQTV